MTLRCSPDLAAAAFDAAPLASAIVTLTPKPEFIEGNQSLERMLEDDPRAYFARIQNEPEGSELVRAIRLSVSLGAPRVVALSVNGQRRHVRLRAVPLANDHDQEYLLLQLQPLAKQESRERELRTTVERLRDLVDNSTALMYIKDLDGRYLIVNDYFVRLFGVSADAIVGHTDHELFHDRSAAVYSQHDHEVITTGQSIEVEEPFSAIGGISDPDDNRRWLSIKFPLLDDTGRPYAVGAISTDITDRKRAESAAKEAMHEAERANQSKNEFLSRMSHELRTPLNAILGFAQLLQEMNMPRDAHESVAHILNAGHHLLTLVNEVLDLTWIEAGAPGIANSPVPAIEPIHQALELIRPLAGTADIEVASDLHGALHRYIYADSQRLRQVFLNLLGNAVKFNSPRGAIRVRCQVEGSMLRYLITDTGPGIHADEADQLFTPFVRLSSAAQTEGTGLGLALSRRLVMEMGGALGIEHTAPGEGSTFYVEMPLAEGPAETEGETQIPTELSSLKTMRQADILHIEDTYANIRLIENVIAKMGSLRVTPAISGAAGIALAFEMLPQLILLDLNLSDMSGVDVVKRLRADDRTRNIPIVILSADATPARMAELAALQIDDYLTKPLDLRLFALTVRRCLEP